MDGSIRSVKVFSATMARQRDALGERLTEWIRDHSDIRIIRTVVAQSSDLQFHCLSIVLFCGEVHARPGDLEPGSLPSSHRTSTAGDGGLPTRVSEQTKRRPKRGRIEP